MIYLNCEFYLTNGKHCKVPRAITHGTQIRVSLHTPLRPMDCGITYLGTDETLKPDKWYNGVVYLIYGEAFPPFGNKFEETILPGEFELYCGGDLVGGIRTISFKEFEGYYDFPEFD